MGAYPLGEGFILWDEPRELLTPNVLHVHWIGKRKCDCLEPFWTGRKELALEKSLTRLSTLARASTLRVLKAVQAQEQVQPDPSFYFHKGKCSSYHLAKVPHLKQQCLESHFRDYHIPDLLPALHFFFAISCKDTEFPPIHTQSYPSDLDVDIPKVSHASAWHSFRLMSSTIQDENVEAAIVTVQALLHSLWISIWMVQHCPCCQWWCSRTYSDYR